MEHLKIRRHPPSRDNKPEVASQWSSQLLLKLSSGFWSLEQDTQHCRAIPETTTCTLGSYGKTKGPQILAQTDIGHFLYGHLSLSWSSLTPV